RRRHTRCLSDWSSDVCSSDLTGYYGGRGARLMKTLGPFVGEKQPDPETGPKNLHECRWKAAMTVTIPADWPSGVYLGRLTCLPRSEERRVGKEWKSRSRTDQW